MGINEETIAKTTDCMNSFACLSNPRQIQCEVESQINDALIFVKCQKNCFCPYKMAFGNFFTCNCPTRMEIYKKYKL